MSNLRAEYNVVQSKQVKIFAKPATEEIKNLLIENTAILEKFLNPENLEYITDFTSDEEVVSIVLNDVEMYLPLGSLVDISQEIERLEKELKKLNGEIRRGEGMLSNPNFINKAPEQKVLQEKAKLDNYKEQYEVVKLRLEALKK